MNSWTRRIWAWGTAAAVAAACGAAQAQQAGPAAAGAGAAAAVVSKGQQDVMQNAEKQARELERAEQGREKAGAAAAENKMRTPKPASSLPKVAPADAWRFSEVKAVRFDASGNRVPDTEAGTAAAKLLLMKVSAGSKEELLAEAQKTMRENGYYLYNAVETSEAGPKLVALTADLGHVANLTVEFVDEKGNQTKPQYFTEEQIRNRYMRGVGANEVFNYNTLYDRFYQLNAHPDLKGKLTLHPVTKEGNANEVDNPEIRRLAMRLRVEEELPLHFVFGVDNNGTDAAENWMGRATVQYLNLTKHDDAVTLNYQNSLTDIDALGGIAASYYLPHALGGIDAAFTLYGGWTDVDSEDVVPGIDVQGEGWFAGVQESFTVFESKRRSLKLALGVVYRNVEDNLVVQGEKLEGNEVTVAPVSLALMYGEKERDALQGMNFLTVEALHEFSGFLGASDEAEIKAQRAAAEEEYTVVHVQAARLQLLPFLSLGNKQYGNPMLFARVNGQWADGALIPAEQFGLGGDGSVRGYATREYLGDMGASGTLELRIPIVLGWLDRKAGVNDAPWDRWQAVAFFDAGWVKVEDPLPGEEKDKALYGTGVGVRFAATDYLQVKCDLAFPLEKTADSDDLCVHFSGQVQF